MRIDKAAFEKCRSDSIDYAVMEKTRDAVVLPLDAGWSDVGSWSSLFDALPADEEGNVLQGDVLVHDTHDCYVHSTSRLVAAVGHGRSHHRRDQGCDPGRSQGARRRT